MTDDNFSAVEQARGLLLRPSQLIALRSRALPIGMRTLLRVAAGDDAVMATATQRTGELPGVLREACRFYVQQILLDEASDSYRILGADAQAPGTEIKAHYALLMRWMHPDRNPDGWDAVFADRVNRAWNDLRTPERRSAYDGAIRSRPSPESEDWAGQAAPYRARPLSPVKSPGVPSTRGRHGSASTTPTPLQVRWIAGAAVAGLAAIVLFVAWPVSDQAETQAALESAIGPRALSEDRVAAAPVREDAVPDSRREVAAQPVAVAPPPAPVTVATPAAPVRVAQRTGLISPARESLPIAAAPVAASRRQVNPSVLASRGNAAPPLPVADTASEKRTADVPPRGMDAQPAPALADPASAPVEAVAVLTESAIVTQPRMPKAPDFDQASLLIGRFAHAYQKGDIEALSALFTADAQSQGGGIEQIRAAYDRLFAGTTQRSISIRDIQWQVADEQARATGKFEISQARDNQAKNKISRGTIRFDIEQHADRLLIARLEHVDRGR